MRLQRIVNTKVNPFDKRTNIKDTQNVQITLQMYEMQLDLKEMPPT